MFNNSYSNFVRPSPDETAKEVLPIISGEEAKRIYLEEIKEASNIHSNRYSKSDNEQRAKKVNNVGDISNKDLFMCVQNDDVELLTSILDSYPEKVNTIDEFGWSLLMIACQANSVESVKVLLKRGVDISVRDKAGNSARSLVIKNRNVVLADILLSCSEPEVIPKRVKKKTVKSKKESFTCEICNKVFPDKDEHLSSTVHNISASKDKKIPANYVIPQTNRGYQIMLRVGWDRESGLGPDGSGNRCPIKTVQKLDRKGLGMRKKRKVKEEKEIDKNTSKKELDREFRHKRNMEINFRREFY